MSVIDFFIRPFLKYAEYSRLNAPSISIFILTNYQKTVIIFIIVAKVVMHL